jgi:hypothetical protein
MDDLQQFWEWKINELSRRLTLVDGDSRTYDEYIERLTSLQHARDTGAVPLRGTVDFADWQYWKTERPPLATVPCESRMLLYYDTQVVPRRKILEARRAERDFTMPEMKDARTSLRRRVRSHKGDDST